MIENAAFKEEKTQAQERDRKTIEAIGAIYCKAHHGKETQKATSTKLCPQCAEVVEYAMARTKRCPNNHEGNCADCEIHCFNGSMREKVRKMMAYAAPRMLARHPFMTIRYLRKKTKQA